MGISAGAWLLVRWVFNASRRVGRWRGALAAAAEVAVGDMIASWLEERGSEALGSLAGGGRCIGFGD